MFTETVGPRQKVLKFGPLQNAHFGQQCCIQCSCMSIFTYSSYYFCGIEQMRNLDNVFARGGSKDILQVKRICETQSELPSDTVPS